ncbi:MAG TPA: hypothetical protein VJ579_02640 [Candidatus Paceibacterota bacterium]|nr:hypothetical protein [Candidatus Paceibacterota bacterium]
MSNQSMSRSDTGVMLSALLLQMLCNLHLAQRALLQGYLTLCDSSLRNALLSSMGSVRFVASEDDAVVMRQMNHVTEKLRSAVDSLSDHKQTESSILEAGIAILDAEAVTSGTAPSAEFSSILEEISNLYLALDVPA